MSLWGYCFVGRCWSHPVILVTITTNEEWKRRSTKSENRSQPSGQLTSSDPGAKWESNCVRAHWDNDAKETPWKGRVQENVVWKLHNENNLRTAIVTPGPDFTEATAYEEMKKSIAAKTSSASQSDWRTYFSAEQPRWIDPWSNETAPSWTSSRTQPCVPSYTGEIETIPN